MAKRSPGTESAGSGSILSKLKSSSKSLSAGAELATDSKLFESPTVETEVPILNLALSGNFSGGVGRGVTMFAGPSRHFKSTFGLMLVKAYMDAKPDAACVFFDNEFGANKSYFDSIGIDQNRVVHCPFMNIEELKSATVNQLESLAPGDEVIYFIDSIGNAASKKELDDAREAKTVADMTRAKQLKSYFRMVTPILNVKNVPMVVINHTYLSQGMYPVDVVSGGTGGVYNSNTIFVIGRRKIKDDKAVTGHEFVLKTEKSRSIREGSKFAVSVTYDGGVDKYSGLLDIAIVSGHVVSPKQGWYEATNPKTGEIIGTKKWRRAETSCAEFWDPIFKTTDFAEWASSAYRLGSSGAAVAAIQSSIELEREPEGDDHE